MKITQAYAEDMAKFLCSQLDVSVANPAYLKCNDLSHIGDNCGCKEVYAEKLTTEDDSFEKYLSKVIYEFIENK